MSAPDTVTAAFPYDGPHTPERVTDAAAALYELTRYLANATQGAAAVPSGPDLGAILSHLSAAASTLPQTFRQLDRAALRIASDPTLYDDQGDDARGVAGRLSFECDEAAARASDLAEQIDKAHGFASRLGHRE